MKTSASLCQAMGNYKFLKFKKVILYKIFETSFLG